MYALIEVARKPFSNFKVAVDQCCHDLSQTLFSRKSIPVLTAQTRPEGHHIHIDNSIWTGLLILCRGPKFILIQSLWKMLLNLGLAKEIRTLRISDKTWNSKMHWFFYPPYVFFFFKAYKKHIQRVRAKRLPRKKEIVESDRLRGRIRRRKKSG